MPITLNNSNISVTYNTGSNYIIETVKSDLYVRGTTSGNLSPEPTVSPSIRSDIVVETFTYTTGTTQTTYDRNFSEDTLCDILIVGGGGGGSPGHGGGGGAGQLILIRNATLNGTYTINVGKGGIGGRSSELANSFPATKGSNSSFGTVIAEGGGANTNIASDKNGGSGAGGDWWTSDGGTGGFGVKNTTVDTFASGTVYSRGNNGGNITSSTATGGGGGGAGVDANLGVGGNGLSGISEINFDFLQNFGQSVGVYISGENKVYFAGGGGGGNGDASITGGGKGGGGNGGSSGSGGGAGGGNATNNTGSGGGGGAGGSGSGGNGGSGIVILRYKNEPKQNGNEKQMTFTFDKTKNIEYLAQLKTGVGGWRIVRFLPPTYSANYPINDDLVGSTSVNSAYNYTNFWTIPFGTFDEFVFATFNMKYWLQTTKVQAIGTNYSNSARTIIRSSISSTSYTANWYNRVDTPEDPQIGLRNHGTAPFRNPDGGGDFILYNQQNPVYGTDVNISPTIDGGLCVLVRDSTAGTLVPIPNIYRVKINRSTKVKINNTQSYTLFDIGTYDIIMGNTKTEIVNTRNPSIVIGTYTNINENEMKFTYSINKTLNELNRETTVFGSTIPSIKNSTNYYSLGNKTINTIVKYKININRIHTIDNHVLRVYVQNTSGSFDEIVGDARIIEKISDETNVTIILTTYYITINKNISGNIFLTSEKQIFYVEESGRNEFNSFTESKFTTDINNMLINNDDLAELNIQFGVTEETNNKNTATRQLINLNDSTNPISISYNNSIINNDSKNSLNTLITTYNNVYSFDESNVSGQLQPIKNIHNFGNVLSPITTKIGEYISYELPTEKVPQTRNMSSFNIKNTATKYIYFIKI